MNEIASRASLPQDVVKMHKQQLQGSHVLQIDELVNIEAPIENLGRVVDEDEDEEKALEKKQRREANGGARGGRGGAPIAQNQRQQPQRQNNYRTFKLSLTDGVQKVFGLEYRRVHALDLERTPPGTKIVVRDVLVRRGMLLLIPQNVQVLGGGVTRLIDAQIRATESKRRRGQGLVDDEAGPAKQDPTPEDELPNVKRPRLGDGPAATAAASTTSIPAGGSRSSWSAATLRTSVGLNSSAPKPHPSSSSSSSSSSFTPTPTPAPAPKPLTPSSASASASSSSSFSSTFMSSLVPARTATAPTPRAHPPTTTASSSSSSLSSAPVVSIPFFSRSSSIYSSSSSSSSYRSPAMQPSPPTPPGINDSNDSIEDEEETKPPPLARVKKEVLEKREERTKKDLSLSLKTVKKEPAMVASDAVISLIDEEQSQPSTPIPMPVKKEPESLKSDDFLAGVSDSGFGFFSLGDLPELNESQWDQTSSALPFVYIDQLQSDMATGRKATLKAASIELLKGSFQYKTGQYSLELKLEDGSGTLQALMSDELVAELMGVTCTEFKSNLTRGPEGINENKRRMRQLEVALFNLEGLMDVTLADPKPVVTGVHRPTVEHIKHLLSRVSPQLS